MADKIDIKDAYSLSPMQEGMLFHYLMDKKALNYFEQMSFRVSGEIDIKLFEDAFNRLMPPI
jgi:tyrocidine synthetase-3